jgi:putative ATPase
MGKQGYGKGYRYDHDWQYHYSGQNCLPEELKTRNFYHPGDLGFEKEIQKRIEFFEKIKNGLKKD